MTREELIAALEAATGPSRELDAAIFSHLYGWSYPLVGAAVHDFRENGAAYTASIDAALTLVPDGCEAVIWTAGGADVFPATPGLRAYDATHAATPAIALCIAALRARA
jgi:hypothetical protein